MVNPWSDHEVKALFTNAKFTKPKNIAPLILIAAYTGMRIEEICNLKVDDVIVSSFRVNAEKTKATGREVPIHSTIFDLVQKLKNRSNDGYLIPGLSIGSYDSRSHSIGQKFSKMKKKMGFNSRQKCFHSFRHNVAIKLREQGCDTTLIIDLVGPVQGILVPNTYVNTAQTLSSGLYETKKNAMETITYDGLLGLAKEYTHSIQ